ncbi:hypothetical protein ACWD7Y_01775 [Streptomyces drozdowiczii]|uniref:hypothetical protein n=1 Tax=unclassified Streptomyces TaxID=2593676 RepID=UPI0008056C3C|nr:MULTISPECIES: hypothetical protein [unclassified Streptomyces]MYR71306.1 hypothetical protein [Streptomyces sp. SID4925]SBV02561.1 hypothetical protein YUMDRAFT_02808 [Streptomyces sp. OspMP-M45]
MARKTDKQCAQAALAAAIVGRTKRGTTDALNVTLTRDEMRRAQAYLKSGKPVTGR